MRTFVQLKDSVGWASINTTEEIPDAIEVEFGTGDFYINKKYENGTWNNADLIRYAVVDNLGNIVEIDQTYFSSNVSGPVLDINTKPTSKWINEQWEHLQEVLPLEDVVGPAEMTVFPVVYEDEEVIDNEPTI